MKDPLFSWGALSIILLVGIIFLIPKTTIKSIAQADASVSGAFSTSSESSEDSLFAEPVKNFLNDSPELTIFQENSLARVSSPVTITTQTLGAVVGDNQAEEGRKEIIEYIVEDGDSISSIASKFGISVNTILWANNLKKGVSLKSGSRLILLPVSGVVYHVKKGDVLGEIAKTFKGKTDEIIAFNDLSGEKDIYIGDILIVPNGSLPVVKAPAVDSGVPIGDSYFIYPTSPVRITQWLHWYNAIDFGGQCGDPIYAAAGGKVLNIKYGWNGGGGNYITILHLNGVVTYYGHLTAALVSIGQDVSQGDMIALMGGKPGTPGAGNSTGCHVHFAVKGARNPFAR